MPICDLRTHAMTALTLPAPATRTRGGDLRSLPGALRSEWIKLSTLRANRAVPWLTAVIGALTAWSVATFVTDEVLYAADVFVFSTVLTAVLAAVPAVLLFTSEVEHGTLAGTMAAQPARWVTVLAKALMAGGRGLALGVIGMATSFAAAVAAGLDVGDTSTMAATVGWALTFTTLAALLGLGVGMILRSSSAAVSGLLVWWFVVENLLFVFVTAEVQRFFPFAAGNNLLGLESDLLSPEQIAVALSRPANALVFAGYTAVALLAGAVLLHKRDVSG